MSHKKSLCQMHKSRNGAVHIHPGKSCPGGGGSAEGGGVRNDFTGSGFGGGLIKMFCKVIVIHAWAGVGAVCSARRSGRCAPCGLWARAGQGSSSGNGTAQVLKG